MWQYDYYGEGVSLIYYLDNNPIIEIEENVFKLKYLKKFIAQIVPREEVDKERFTRYQSYQLMNNQLTEDDLEIFKVQIFIESKRIWLGCKLNRYKVILIKPHIMRLYVDKK